MPFVCGLLHGAGPLGGPSAFLLCFVARLVGAWRGLLGGPSAVFFFVILCFSRVWISTTLSTVKPIAMWTQVHEWCGLVLRNVWFARACELIVTESHTPISFQRVSCGNGRSHWSLNCLVFENLVFSRGRAVSALAWTAHSCLR